MVLSLFVLLPDRGATIELGGADLERGGPIEIVGNLEYLVEGDRRFTPDDVTGGDSGAVWTDFRRSLREAYSGRRPVWFRFGIDFDTAPTVPWYLQIVWPFLDRVEIHVRDTDEGVWIRHAIVEGGEAGTYRFDPVPFLLELDVPGVRSAEVYLRVESTVRIVLPLRLWRSDTLVGALQRRNLLMGIFFGALVVMLVYNTVIFLFTGDTSYGIYILYVFFVILYVAGVTGFGAAYLWRGNQWIGRYTYSIFSSASFLTAGLFIRRVLELTRRRDWMLYAANTAVVGWLIIIFLYLVTDAYWVVVLEDAWALFSCVIGLFIPVARWIRGDVLARYLSIAWIFLLSSTLLFMLGLTGIIPYRPVYQTIQNVGFMIEVTLLSLALAARINRERSEKEEAQELSIKLYREADEARERELVANARALEIERTAKENLRAKVEEKTGELQRALSELERTNRELAVQSTTDGLTQVSNRRQFEEIYSDEFTKALRSEQPLSIVLGDIDHFKTLNDTYGHQTGDECLRKVADVFRDQISRTGDLVARYGGEEFIALLPNTTEESAAVVAERVRRAITAVRFPGDLGDIRLTISMGVCGFAPGPEDTPDGLVKRADDALYRAKREGRNRTVRATSEPVPDA